MKRKRRGQREKEGERGSWTPHLLQGKC